MTDLEKLTIAQALYKAIAAAVSTKDPDSLRGRADVAAIKAYEATGAKGFDLRLRGRKVGTYSVRVSKPVHRTDLAVRDRAEFEGWCMANDMAETRECWTVRDGLMLGDEERAAFDLLVRSGVIRRHIDVLVTDITLVDARRHMAETGEVPDGCEAIVVDEPSRPVGTTLRVDVALVADALGDGLPGALAGLLADGGEAA